VAPGLQPYPNMKLNRILIPLDGSTLAESALTPAMELAGPAGATLLLVRAAEAHVVPAADPVEAQVKVVREAEAYLESVAERLRRQGAHAVEPSVWYGPAPASIVDAARLRAADLIVMTTHGRSGLGRLIVGSVAESVLRGTTTPILLLRAPGAPLSAVPGSGQARPAQEVARD
jgi:nucleotide-binding universal stress UspA family protein